MINSKSILAIIPARGGSKGIPRKNIKLLAGKPLIVWTIEEAKKSKYIDRIILSSEDEETINVAKEYGCEVPFVRPKELAQDETAGIEPVIHAINSLSIKYDYICLLQPTSPLRKVVDIDGCILSCISNNSESCVSVTIVDKHPYWMYEIDENKKLEPLFSNNIIRRQDLHSVYVLNGAVYFCSTKMIIETEKLIEKNTLSYEMSKLNSLDIDDNLDFELAEFLIKRRPR